MCMCFCVCVGVSKCVGLVLLKQLLALLHIARYLVFMASHCSCHFSSIRVRMTAKLPSRDPGAGLSEHAQCGRFLGDLTSECKRQRSTAAGISVCLYPAAFFIPTALNSQPWGKENLRLLSSEVWQWMNESKLGLTFKEKQVNIYYILNMRSLFLNKPIDISIFLFPLLLHCFTMATIFPPNKWQK